MDLTKMLQEKIFSLDIGDYTQGLKSILVHLDAAHRHWDRGVKSGDNTAFTDTIYRTNQVFEGSIKESYRVLAGMSPEKRRAFDIEKYLTENAIFRSRVLNQFTNYRQEWRNPSTHDYRLDFDSSESFLAIVSVAAFACLLLDQITEKISFDKTRSQITDPSESEITVREAIDNGSFLEVLAQAIAKFCSDPNAYTDANHNEAQLIGALHAYLSIALPHIVIQIEPLLLSNSKLRCDMLAICGEEKIIIEIKRLVKYQYTESTLDQVARYMDASKIRSAILFFGPKNLTEVNISDHREIRADGMVKIIYPRSFSNEAEVFPKDFP